MPQHILIVGGGVGGSIVDDDHLDRLVLLLAHACHRISDEALAVVHGDDHADQWGGLHRSSTRLITDGMVSMSPPSSRM